MAHANGYILIKFSEWARRTGIPLTGNVEATHDMRREWTKETAQAHLAVIASVERTCALCGSTVRIFSAHNHASACSMHPGEITYREGGRAFYDCCFSEVQTQWTSRLVSSAPCFSGHHIDRETLDAAAVAFKGVGPEIDHVFVSAGYFPTMCVEAMSDPRNGYPVHFHPNDIAYAADQKETEGFDVDETHGYFLVKTRHRCASSGKTT